MVPSSVSTIKWSRREYFIYTVPEKKLLKNAQKSNKKGDETCNTSTGKSKIDWRIFDAFFKKKSMIKVWGAVDAFFATLDVKIGIWRACGAFKLSFIVELWMSGVP